ncbi:LPXTG cell wall anchor domain-containing protein, partial [Bacillus toyonensis]
TSKANGLASNSNYDKKEYTYKELPKTGASTTNSAIMGMLMVIAATVLTLVRKCRKIQK